MIACELDIYLETREKSCEGSIEFRNRQISTTVECFAAVYSNFPHLCQLGVSRKSQYKCNGKRERNSKGFVTSEPARNYC